MSTLKHILLLLSLTALPLMGKADADHAASAPQQTTCPVMVGIPIDPALFVDYQGRRVYLCCKTCEKLFSENPEEYLKNLPQFAEVPAEHAPETNHADTARSSRLIPFIGKLHPIAVHLPIALFLVVALAELLFLFTGVPLFRSAARFNLLIAVPTAAVSVLLGLASASGTTYPPDYARVLFFHKALGISILVLGTVATTFSELVSQEKGEASVTIYRTTLFITALLVGIAGHLGGLLVHGLHHLSW